MSTTYPATDARRAQVLEAGGGATESMGGVAVVILAILALVGVVPRVLLPISGIIFGAAFLVEGAAVAARQANVAGAEMDIGGAVTVELVAGLAAIVLGVLALIGIDIPVLMGALVITGGAGLILSAGLVDRILPATAPAGVIRTTSTSSAAAAHLLAGLAAVVLGILALTNAGASTVLSTVGLLVLGGSLTLSGAGFSAMMLRLFQRG